MKTIYVLLFLFWTNQVNAQLTNSQVYNFEIGDVFQTSFGANFPGPHPVLVDTIVNKTYSTNLDSITYTINRLTYLAPASFGGAATYSFSTQTLIVTNLNLPAGHFPYLTCLPATDTVLIGNCNEYIERLHSNYDTSCFEPSTWYSDLYEGLGGPYYYRLDPSISGSGNDWYSKTLTYYNTAQQGSCGNLVTFVGIDELAEIKLLVFPNPASEKLHVNTEFQKCQYKIFAENGGILKSETIQQPDFEIDIKMLKPGNYFLEVDGHNGSLIKRSFIKG